MQLNQLKIPGFCLELTEISTQELTILSRRLEWSHMSVSLLQKQIFWYMPGIYPGIPIGFQNNHGSLSESVYSGFYCEIAEKIRWRYTELGNAKELHTLPQPLDFVIKTPAEILEQMFLFENILPFPEHHDDLRPLVHVIGHSNMRFVTEELKTVLNGELKVTEYTPKLDSNKTEIDFFFSKLGLQESDTVVFSGLSNMLLQG